jgi:hypothetical protein
MLGEFLLPSSNILPRTYQGLHAIMKDIGMDYQTIYACPNDHIIYYGQHASKKNVHNVLSVDIEPIK